MATPYPEGKKVFHGHIVFHLSVFRRFSDKELKKCFITKKNATEIREYLKELRDNGYEFMPCECNPPAPGKCPGW